MQGFLEIIIPKRYRSSHHRCFTKRLFLKSLPYSQENTCVGVSFLIKLQAFSSATLSKTDSAQVFPVDIAIFLKKNTNSKEHLQTTAFDLGKIFEKYLKKSLTKNELSL